MALFGYVQRDYPKKVDTVLALLPILLCKKAKLYNIQTEALSLDLNCYSKEFAKFIKVLYEENNEAQHFIVHPKLLNCGDIST